jgi:hypothetical protein
LDILNTASIPSARCSGWLNTLINKCNLIDPFRYFYPDTQEYTYVPYSVDAVNRSRIDFFLISERLAEQCVNCRIPHSLSSLLFDHKQVFLYFKRNNPYKKQELNDTILKDLNINQVVNLATLDCYINHLAPSDALSDLQIDELKLIIGQAVTMQHEIASCRLSDAMLGTDPVNIARIQELVQALNNTIELLPALEDLQEMELSCSNDVFLEILIMSVKNSSLSHQQNFFKIKNAKKNSLEKRIIDLKKDFYANAGEILRTERELNKIVDDAMREEILKMKNFEHLNSEKITPYFLSLAKKNSNKDSLADICREDGTPFDTVVERNAYIRNYYADTYKKLPDTVDAQSIETFLGDVAEHPSVIECKINNEEREFLERDLTLNEFDRAMERAKINTSPGIDSISNRFIKNFCNIFRVPLFKYSKCCYAKGILTENFRCTKIRLIPKKGDTTLMKNWRPISLLNCFYKLISKVIAMRLGTVMDKITRIGQKGFSKTKYCQEVLIGIIDSISRLRYRNRSGALLSLDIKKAFDSTSHSYLQEAYRFFNFGPNFIRWLNLIGTNRKACIILDDGTYSDFFDLERGNAQGDTTSPYIFNIGFQILLLKLTFDLQIEGLFDFPVPPDNTPPLPRTVGTYIHVK